MSDLPQVLEEETLTDKLEEAIDVDPEIPGPNGGTIEMPEHIIRSIQVQNVADTLAEHISQVALNLDEIESTTLAFSSGDTGNQSQLYLNPEEDISKEELREIATELDIILNEMFPTEYIIGIKHGKTIDEDGYPKETDSYSLFIVYRVRTTGSPSRPAGDSTEVI